MRNILRLSLTLAVVGLVSAALLTVVNNWTAPIIAERQLQDYLRSVREFFPGAEQTRQEELEGALFDLIYDGAGNLLGVIGKNIEYKGYGGPVKYNLAVDKEGKIVGYRIVSHSETPGIGDIITRPEYQGKFTGKGPAEIDGVDTQSGATVSTSAIKGSIKRVTAAAGAAFLGMEEERFDISAVPDGIYQGTGKGLLGDIVVEVTVSGGKIAGITVLEQSETPTFFVNAYPAIPDLIVAEQKLEVDTRTGATGSAEGIVKAVRDALEKALAGGEK